MEGSDGSFRLPAGVVAAIPAAAAMPAVVASLMLIIGSCKEIRLRFELLLRTTLTIRNTQLEEGN